MTKHDVVNQVASSTGIIQADVETVINAFLCVISDSIGNHKEVRLNGFGTFKTRLRAKKVARNLEGRARGTRKNPEPIHLPEKVVPQFRFSKTFIQNYDNRF